MKSKISFFKSFRSFEPYTVRKNIIRFAPLWAIYTLIWLLSLSMPFYRTPATFAGEMAFNLQIMPVYNFLYAFCCAQLLFGDLYKTRMCYSLHALPMTREAWFTANTLSGLLFSLVPNLLVALIILLGSGYAWTVAPLWLLGTTLQFIFFFGLATLCAYIVGSRFAMLTVYTLLNFLSWLVYAILDAYYIPLLPGVILDDLIFSLFSPLVQMCNSELVEVEAITKAVQTFSVYGPEEKVQEVGAIVTMGAGWGYLWICAGIGIGLLALALGAYRKRHLESAGDFLAFPWLRPVFLIIYCAFCGLLTSSFFFGVGFFLFPGMIIGWFTGKMLLDRTIRVFHKKSLLGCAGLVLALVISTGLTLLDPLGLTRWMPKRTQIETVELSMGYTVSKGVPLSDDDALDMALTIHRYGIENPEENTEFDSNYVVLKYALHNGQTVKRRYCVPESSPVHQQMKQHFSRLEYVLETEDPEAFWQSIVEITDNEGRVIAHDSGLYAALAQDAREGNLAQYGYFRADSSIVFEMRIAVLREATADSTFVTRNTWVYINDSCRYTVAWLTENGYMPKK